MNSFTYGKLVKLDSLLAYLINSDMAAKDSIEQVMRDYLNILYRIRISLDRMMELDSLVDETYIKNTIKLLKGRIILLQPFPSDYPLSQKEIIGLLTQMYELFLAICKELKGEYHE